MMKRRDLAKINEANMEVALRERSGGLSEVTGKPGGAIHHILGRGYPEGYRDAPEEVKEVWPHCEVGCIVLTGGEHYVGHGLSKNVKSPRMLKHLLLAWMLHKYGDRMWRGKPYRYWLAQEPYKRWL